MNLPNKMTLSRMVMAPLFFILFFLPIWFGAHLNKVSVILLLAVYVFTELSDLLDGIIARKYNLVTDLGKVMDPFADTFSRLTYFVCLVSVNVMPVWSFIIIMWREFSILFLRMLMMRSGTAVAASIWGKIKAVLYAISALIAIVYVAIDRIGSFGEFKEMADTIVVVVFALATIASVASFLTYMRAIIRSKVLSTLSR